MDFLKFYRNVAGRFYALSHWEEGEAELNVELIKQSINEIIAEYKNYIPYWAVLMLNNTYIPLGNTDYQGYLTLRCQPAQFKKFGHIFYVYYQNSKLPFEKQDFYITVKIPDVSTVVEENTLCITTNLETSLEIPVQDLGEGLTFQMIQRNATEQGDDILLLPDELIAPATEYCLYKLSTVYPVGKKRMYERFLLNYLSDKERRLKTYMTENYINKMQTQPDFPDY